MSFSLAHKTVLITGATDGLGKEIAHRLLEEKANLIIHGRTKERVEATLSEFKKEYPQAKLDGLTQDLERSEEIPQAFSHVKQLDVLINNAGVWLEGNTIDAPSEKIVELVKVNTLAPLLITQTLLATLLKADYGQLVNIVSIAGVEIPAGYYHTIYTATKYAMQGFSEGLAKEFYTKNFRVMGYYPGGMNTNIFKKSGNDYKMNASWMFDKKESADAVCFMLTRSKDINIKRMDLIKQ